MTSGIGAPKSGGFAWQDWQRLARTCVTPHGSVPSPASGVAPAGALGPPVPPGVEVAPFCAGLVPQLQTAAAATTAAVTHAGTKRLARFTGCLSASGPPRLPTASARDGFETGRCVRFRPACASSGADEAKVRNLFLPPATYDE